MLEMFIVSQEIVDDTVKEYLSDILFGVSSNEKEINQLIELTSANFRKPVQSIIIAKIAPIMAPLYSWRKPLKSSIEVKQKLLDFINRM